MALKFFDAFAGIGGFRLGMERAGHQCIGGCEIDKYARGIYEHRFGISEHHYGDIRSIDPAGLPDFDVLCGGFPCQSHSIAGHRGGLSDDRGSLFFELIRIAKAKNPAYLFFENVKGILSSDNGWAFWRVLKEMDDAGYDAEWSCCNTKDFGPPQNRERIFIIGRSRAIRGPQIFPLRESHYGDPQPHGEAQGEGEQLQDQDSQCGPVVNALDANYGKGSRGGRTLLELTSDVGDAHRIYDSDGLAKTLKGEAGGMGAKTGLYLIRKNMKGKGHREDEPKYLECGETSPTIMSKADYNAKVVYKSGFGDKAVYLDGDTVPPLKASSKHGDSEPLIVQGNQRREYVLKEESGAVQSSMSGNQVPHVITPDSVIRRLTPLECERLQGFPDGWTEEGLISGKVVKISDSQRYKVCGNAVSVPVIYEIAKTLK